jgi:hypothetical protein
VRLARGARSTARDEHRRGEYRGESDDAEQAGVICPGYVDAGRFLKSIDLLLVPSTARVSFCSR